MNKTIKRNVVVSAILAIMLCVSLIAGATFALFTSESKTNIAVTSGKVNVTAKIDETSVLTKANGDAAYISGADHMYEATAQFNEDGLTLTKMLPGDGIQFNIVVTNNSDVTVKYRTIIACEADEDLLDGLNVRIDGEAYNGTTKISPYSTLSAGSSSSVATVPVSVEMNESAGNEYQNKTFKFSYKVEAVQGNANTSDPDQNTTYIYTPNDLMALQSMNNITKVEFLQDIDMSGYAWTGLKSEQNFSSSVTFAGNNKAISNLSAPLVTFTLHNVTVSNLTIKDSQAMGTYYDYFPDEGEYLNLNGAFVTYSDCANITLTNCSLTDVKMSTLGKWNGGFVGYISGQEQKLTMTNCSVNRCQIYGNGSIGGLVGHSDIKTAELKNCSVKNSTFEATEKNWRVASFVGTVLGDVIIQNPVYSNNNLSMNDSEHEGQQLANPNHEIYGRIVDPGSLTVDGTAYVFASQFKQVLSASNNVTLTKDYVILDNWTSYKEETGSIYQPISEELTIDGGYVDENGEQKCHTISGLTASLLAPNASKKISISNLTIYDSKIAGVGSELNTSCAGAFISYADNTVDSLSLENCHAVNVTAKTADGDISGVSAGALVGYLYITDVGVSIKNCSATQCTVSSTNGNAAGIVGMSATANNNENFIIENCKVEGCKITGEKPEKTGAIIGTVNNGGIMYMDDCSVSGCTTGTNTTLTKVYGRIVGPDTILKIDGVEYSN